MKTTSLIQGNEAITQGAFYAGARFYAGYPITPSSEIAQICAREMPKIGGIFMQMEDELASMGAIIGASLSGAKSFTATSGPGFSLMQENLGMGSMGEVPLVVVNVQRSGPSTGLATKPAQSDMMQLRWGRHGDQSVVALIPSTVAECFELTVKAFNIAEKYRTQVIVAPDEVVGHMRESYRIPEPGELEVIDRIKPDCSPEDYKPFSFERGAVAPLAAYGDDHVFHVTSSMHDEKGFSCNTPENAARRVAQLHTKLEDNLDDIIMVREFDTDGCELLIVTYGVTTRAARTAAIKAQSRGLKVGVLQLQTVWPFPSAAVVKAARNARAVIVPEMNYAGQMAGEVGRVLDVSAKIRRVNSFNGTIMFPEAIEQALY